MSSCLRTAPSLSSAYEEREKADLTPQEKDDIDNDIYGHSAIPLGYIRDGHVADMSNLELPLELFEDALDKIPLQDKMVYERALVECPHLVRTESNPVRFLLSSEDRNVETAAQKLVNYWEMRKVLFNELCFQPITLQGAMIDDIPTLIEVPNMCRIVGIDQKGRPILMGNMEGVDLRKYPREQLVRILWYNIHIMLHEQATISNGIVIVNLGRRIGFEQFDRKRNHLYNISLGECLPIKIQAVHLVTNSLMMKTALPVAKWSMGKRLRMRVIIHRGDDQEIIRELYRYGLDLIKNSEYFDAHNAESSIWVLEQLDRETQMSASRP